ncbi:MAG: NAD(P)/FAD-dependent oxidoreductase [Hyphomicrobiaceae bacterium]|nr:NAD(P)/FAD-dependent oxidoreductase [Hyphomicrobiaceae bacterium]
MRTLNRRDFGKAAGRAGLVAATSTGLGSFAIAQGAAKVVVVGGGAGGATVAAAVKKTAPELDVTLVEVNPVYTTCFFSNLYLGGLQTIDDITHSYDGLKGLGVKIVNDYATGVDAAKKTVSTKGGTTLAYDRLVLSPGIDIKFDSIAGYSPEAAEVMPHAWKAGPQTKLLKAKLDAMEDGGLFVMAAPPNPYRCPPGPYERVCMIASFLKAKKPKSKIILLDAKNAFSKQAPFLEGIKKHYGDMVEVALSNDIDSFAVVKVDAKTGEIETKSGRKEKAAVANIIPAQRAGEIAIKAGAASGDWCPVKPENMASALLENVYVLGDASVATEMPKSAFSANSQAKVVANDIVAALAGKPKFPPRYRNTCWSAIAPDDGIKIGANYAPGEKDGKPALVAKDSFVSKAGEADDLRKETYKESFGWYSGIVADIFAKA